MKQVPDYERDCDPISTGQRLASRALTLIL